MIRAQQLYTIFIGLTLTTCSFASLVMHEGSGALTGHAQKGDLTGNINKQCSGIQNTDLQLFCSEYGDALALRAQNVANMLHTLTGKSVSYSGYFRFFTLSEDAPFLSPYSDQYIMPSELPGVKGELLKLFTTLGTSNLNYAARITPELLGPHVTLPSQPTYLPYQQPEQLSAFAEDYYQSLFYTYNSNKQQFRVPNTGKALRLRHQFGSGGGFGYYLGPIVTDSKSNEPILGIPMLQFGGGMGQGISEGNGIDFGFGGGANCLPGQPTCRDAANSSIGGGAGIGNPLTNNQAIIPDEDHQGLPHPDAALIATFQSTLKKGTANHSYFYMSGGSGGGGGFQTLPIGQDTGVFQQSFGFGGGGYSLIIFKLSNPSDSISEPNNFMVMGNANTVDPYSSKVFNLWATNQLQSELTMLKNYRQRLIRHAQLEGISQAAKNNAERGLYTATGVSRFSFQPNDKVSLIYQPYHFPLPTDITHWNTKYVYIPGSNSNADLFFSQNGNILNFKDNAGCSSAGMSFIDSPNNGLIKNDMNIMTSLNVDSAGVLYALNTNPSGCIFENANINNMVLSKLNQSRIPVTLGLHITVLPGDNTQAGVPAIIKANNNLINTTITTLKQYPNIHKIALLQDQLGVVQSFPHGCNIYSFQSPTLSNLCGGYSSSLSFKDYLLLVQQLKSKILAANLGRPITLLLEQSQTNWFTPPTVKRQSATSQSLAAYFTQNIKPLGTQRFIIEPLINIVATYQETFDSAYNALENITLPIAKAQLSGSNGLYSVAAGWKGSNNSQWQQYLKQVLQLGDNVGAVDTIYLNQLFNQPWKGIPNTFDNKPAPGMPGATCGHVYPISYLDRTDPMGPPLTQQIPTVCAPNYTNTKPGAQPAPVCMCLTNSTNYYSTFYGFISNTALPPTNAIANDGGRNFIHIPPKSVMTFARGAANSFYTKNVQGKDGGFSLATIYKQVPYSLSATCLATPGAKDCPYTGQPVTIPTVFNPNKMIPYLRCAGVSDAQYGAANANSGFGCDQVFFLMDPSKTFMQCDGGSCGTLQSDGMYHTTSNNITLNWTAQGTGYPNITGWQLKTIEAPPPAPGQTATVHYQKAPLVIIPLEDNKIDAKAGTVRSSYTYKNLSPGIYWFRIQPVSGVPAVDGIDIEYQPVKITNPSGKTDWTQTGKFTIDIPMTPIITDSGKKAVVKSVTFAYQKTNPTTQSKKWYHFILYRPVDNGISDISLPGNQNNQAGGKVAFPVTLTVAYQKGETCTLHLGITPGSNVTPDGQANVLSSSDKASPTCNMRINGDTMEFKRVTNPKTPPSL